MSEQALEPEVINISADPQYSSVQNIGIINSFSYQLVYASGAGTATLQYSNNGIDFDDVSNMTNTLSGTDSCMWAPPPRGVAYARVRFDGATGLTGTLTLFNKGEL